MGVSEVCNSNLAAVWGGQMGVSEVCNSNLAAVWGTKWE